MLLDARFIVLFVTFFATIEGFSLLDSSLPAAVRTRYLLVVSFVAAGGKAEVAHIAALLWSVTALTRPAPKVVSSISCMLGP